MKRSNMIVGAVAATLLAAVSASAAPMPTTVAGWDFSQYRGAGSMTVDNATFVNTLGANYSNRVQAAGAPGVGPLAAAYGTLYMDGTGGSTVVAPGFGSGSVQPVGANLEANENATANVTGFPGSASFNSEAALRASGQAPNIRKVALGAVSGSPQLVFEADLTPDFPGAGTGGTGWSVSFGGKTTLASICDGGGANDCDADVDIEYEIDGGGYVSAGNVTLTPDEDAYSIAFPATVGKVARVRLTLDTTAGLPIIDNVAVNANYVPEPSLLAQLGAGVLGLLGLARFRR